MAENTENQPSTPAKKKVPLKALLILAIVLLTEVGTAALVYYLSGGPATVKADDESARKLLEMEQEVEELVVADKFPNKRSGRTYVYDTEVYIVVKRKFKDQVERMRDRKAAQLIADVREIISSSEPSQLNEPTLATLTTRIKAAMDSQFGRDEQEDEPIVQRVIISKLIPYQADL